MKRSAVVGVAAGVILLASSAWSSVRFTADQVRRFAPEVRFHPAERFFPASLELLRQRVHDFDAAAGEPLASLPGGKERRVRAPMYASVTVAPDGSHVDLHFVMLYAHNGPQTL